MKCSVFTVCSPEYNIQETAQLLSKLGFDGVEWRIGKPAGLDKPESYTYENRYWTYNKSTLDIDNIEAQVLEAKDACDKNGLELVALSSNLPIIKINEIEALAKAANKVNCKLIRIWAPEYNGSKNYNDILSDALEGINKLMPIAKENNVRFMFEIHMGLITPSASAAYRLAESFDPKYLGFVFDPGNNVYEGFENYKMGLEILGPYMAHVHLKNGKWLQGESDEDGTENYYPLFTECDKGHANLKGLIKTLKEIGYEGYLSVEDFTNSTETEAKLKHNLDFMRNAINS